MTPDDKPSEVKTLYGLYDTVEDIWFGDDDGPVSTENYIMARLAAQVADVRLKQEPGRTKARELPANHVWRKRDSIEPSMTADEALDRMIDGRAL